MMVSPMRIATFNVHKCIGPDGAYRPDRVAAVIAELDADVVAIQEADQRFGKRNGLLDAGQLLATTGMHLLTQSDLPDGHGWHGNTLLVRNKPIFYTRRRLKLPGVEPRGAVVADIDFGFGAIRFVATHMGLLRNCRFRQAGAILSALAGVPPMPTVLLGDLNEWREWRGTLKVLEPFFGRSARCPSFPSRMPMLSLDRIMGWPHDLVTDVEAHKTQLAREASDHLPVKAVLRMEAISLTNKEASELVPQL
jgi:endonuclease/exonuclease/phosphatase family metal-dependent hydrolase